MHDAPAAHVLVTPPLHLTLQAAAAPHTTVHTLLPLQSATQPPFGQAIVHVLSPVHATVEPVSTDTLQVLPPPQVTVLFVPVESSQLLVPSHVVVQLDVHVWITRGSYVSAMGSALATDGEQSAYLGWLSWFSDGAARRSDSRFD